MPPQVELIRLPALWLENGEFTVGDSCQSVETVKESRKNLLISEFDRIKPDCLITEFFPFGRHKLIFELLPLVEHIKNISPNTKIICSLRDVIGKETEPQEEETICDLMNRYFDLLLFHADSKFQQFSESFARYRDIKSEVIHTGFVTQAVKANIDNQQLWGEINPNTAKILVSVGGGRIGYELLETVVVASSNLSQITPHIIKIFTGPFMPEDKIKQLKQISGDCSNIQIETYTCKLLEYMQTADISLSLSGYNTTMNILSTGVRAIVVPIGHEQQDKEQLVRTHKLEQLGIVNYILPQDLTASYLAEKIVTNLNKNRKLHQNNFELNGANKTACFLKSYLERVKLLAL
ncbi:glycosyltransferase family protein [Fortiea sp. LEGE XX443]|uniref:glycosyltransferase family protein n=1 Tax=Fortiea sp. LEGE XX443 TaxID=1828611 RepID=UPI001D1348CD|nr:glycosyltransferase [Fortiea sp. LEGE XX443]